MHPRQSIVELFSTFVQFEADRFSHWAKDARLHRSMQNCIQQTPQSRNSENFWALYWYKVWQSQATSLAKAHLVAYLQEPCYWTAQKTAAGFASTQYTLSDCFQVAIAQIDKVLKGFNPNQGFIFKNYASAIFSSVIRETLRQRHEVDICTPWSLLRKISQKRLVDSLQSAGLSKETIDAYVTAWNCFKTLYTPTQAFATRQLSRPDHATWDAIASLYNAQTHSQQNSETLEKWLLSCAKATRNYLYPAVISINTPLSEEDSVEWVDNLPGTEEDSPLTQIVAQEEEQSRLSQLAEINEMLVAAVTQLEPQAQKLLQLYYRQGLTQQQIAQQMEMKQYTVSRRLTKTREILLLQLAKWSQETLHISLSSDVLKNTSNVLEEWLQAYYSHSEPPSFPE